MRRASNGSQRNRGVQTYSARRRPEVREFGFVLFASLRTSSVYASHPPLLRLIAYMLIFLNIISLRLNYIATGRGRNAQ